jgi:acetyltransferase-like isoleucine patch superfamily enzyme
MPADRTSVQKELLAQELQDRSTSLRARYQRKVLASGGLFALLQYEFITALASNAAGAVGYFLRKLLFPALLRSSGRSTIFGRGMVLRHPDRIDIGEGTAIDDNVMLEAGGGGEEGIRIGADVIISRGCVIQAKTAPVAIGDRSDIGCNVIISSISGVELGRAVLVGGNTYIGGGRYKTDDLDELMIDQGLESKGPVIIEDDVWLGAGVVVIDGSRIGHGSIVGSGAVVTGTIPPFSIAAGVPARVIKTRA